jgi:hypothetical protein
MAFALCLDYAGNRHYIHKHYGTKLDSTKTTINMNYALLFAVESDATRWRRKNNLPIEYQPIFIPINIKEKPKSTEKIYYKRLKDLRGSESVNDVIPDFLKGE